MVSCAWRYVWELNAPKKDSTCSSKHSLGSFLKNNRSLTLLKRCCGLTICSSFNNTTSSASISSLALASKTTFVWGMSSPTSIPSLLLSPLFLYLDLKPLQSVNYPVVNNFGLSRDWVWEQAKTKCSYYSSLNWFINMIWFNPFELNNAQSLHWPQSVSKNKGMYKYLNFLCVFSCKIDNNSYSDCQMNLKHLCPFFTFPFLNFL